MRNNLKLSFLGPQGSGKGTQANLLAARTGQMVLGMGKLLRAAADKGDALGKEIDAIMDRGDLVPNQITIDILKSKLDELKSNQGYILDGFPRNLGQVEMIEGLINLDAIVVFEISDQEAVNRILYRLTCPDGHIYNSKTKPPKVEGRCDIDHKKLEARDDDDEEAVRNRLAIYRTETTKVVNYFKKQSKIIEINGEQTIEIVFKDLLQALEQL